MTDPAPVGDSDTLSVLENRLRERGLDPIPAGQVETAPAIETKREAEARRERRHANYRDRWGNRLPAMYADANLDQVAETATTADPADARKVVTWLAAEASQTLVLAGAVGVGKTHAAYAIGNAAVRRGIWTEAWTVTDLLEAMRPSGDPSVASAVRSCHLLILDDLGAAKATDWAVDAITSLIDARLRENRRQIVTTNHPHEYLVSEWGARLMDRLGYRMTAVVLTGASRRKGW